MVRNWPSIGFCWPVCGIDHAGKAEAHGVADRLARQQSGREADLDRKADRDSGHDFAADQQDAFDGREAAGGQLELRGRKRRNADRERDHEPQLHRHEGGAEHGRGDESGAGRIIATIHSQSCASTPAKPAGIIASAQGSGRRSRW
jgi:hypothetical protein